MAERVRIPVEVTAPATVFDVVSRGYDRAQVDARVGVLEQELAELRWELDDLTAQRQQLADDRESFERERAQWRPSYAVLGERACRLLRLAEEEAAALREQGAQEAQRLRRTVAQEAEQERRSLADELAEARREADRERRLLEYRLTERQAIVEQELAQARRSAELDAAGLLASARAKGEEVLAAAEREAEELHRRTADEVRTLTRRRNEVAEELADLSIRLIALVDRAGTRSAELNGTGTEGQ